MAAHEGHGGFGRHSRPGASLVEHHGHGLAGEAAFKRLGSLAGLDGGLVLRGIEDELGEFLGTEIVDRCEMARG